MPRQRPTLKPYLLVLEGRVILNYALLDYPRNRDLGKVGMTGPQLVDRVFTVNGEIYHKWHPPPDPNDRDGPDIPQDFWLAQAQHPDATGEARI